MALKRIVGHGDNLAALHLDHARLGIGQYLRIRRQRGKGVVQRGVDALVLLLSDGGVDHVGHGGPGVPGLFPGFLSGRLGVRCPDDLPILVQEDQAALLPVDGDVVGLFGELRYLLDGVLPFALLIRLSAIGRLLPGLHLGHFGFATVLLPQGEDRGLGRGRFDGILDSLLVFVGNHVGVMRLLHVDLLALRPAATGAVKPCAAGGHHGRQRGGRDDLPDPAGADLFQFFARQLFDVSILDVRHSAPPISPVVSIARD